MGETCSSRAAESLISRGRAFPLIVRRLDRVLPLWALQPIFPARFVDNIGCGAIESDCHDFLTADFDGIAVHVDLDHVIAVTAPRFANQVPEPKKYGVNESLVYRKVLLAAHFVPIVARLVEAELADYLVSVGLRRESCKQKSIEVVAPVIYFVFAGALLRDKLRVKPSFGLFAINGAVQILKEIIGRTHSASSTAAS